MIIYFRWKYTEEYVETRVRNHDDLKAKTTQSILPDPSTVGDPMRF